MYEEEFFLLSEVLMLNIWLGLSIKSTVRFRCVSKSWCASLSDPHFIYKNLTFSSDDDDRLLLLNRERPHYSLVSHETLIGTAFLMPAEVPNPGSNPDVLTPPLDDMVCFYRGSEDYIGVWNLATCETRAIPRPEIHEYGFAFHFRTLGFGFDEKRKEYKIVQVLDKRKECRTYKMGRDEDSYEAYVYTLSSSSNGWRKLGEPNMPLFKDSDDYFPVGSRSYRDGTFYWGSGELIVSFDMSTEVFNYISIPFLAELRSGIEVIHKLKEGSMLMITMNRDRKYRLWALLELGVIQSWTNLLVWGGKKAGPLGFWRGGVILASYSDGRLIIRDPFEREVKEIQIDESSDDIPKCLVWTHGKKPKPEFLSCFAWTKGKKS